MNRKPIQGNVDALLASHKKLHQFRTN